MTQEEDERKKSGRRGDVDDKPRADQTELHTISIHHLCFFVRQSLFISAICLNWGVVDTLGLHIHRRYANIV